MFTHKSIKVHGARLLFEKLNYNSLYSIFVLDARLSFLMHDYRSWFSIVVPSARLSFSSIDYLSWCFLTVSLLFVAKALMLLSFYGGNSQRLGGVVKGFPLIATRKAAGNDNNISIV